MNDETPDDSFTRKICEEMPYIDDDGFTARVVARLPAPARARRRSLRTVILLLMALVSGATACTISHAGRFLEQAAFQLANLHPTSLLLVALACGVLVTLATLTAALLTQAAGRGWS